MNPRRVLAKTRRTVTPPSMRVPFGCELLAIDPGVQNPGAARFSNGRLVEASRVSLDASWKHLGDGQRCLHVAKAIVHWARSFEAARGLPRATHVVLEWPQWYTETRSGGIDQNDLGRVLGAGAMAIGLLEANAVGTLTVISPRPAEVWGRLPKATKGDPRSNPRGARIWSRLDEAERAVIELSHDAFDAAGLGLWVLGLFEPHHVSPGAT